MIVTRSWLEEFIDLSDICNDKLYETFNSIGLEVDSIKQIDIPQGVVVGKIISCQKHPDADKLSVCQIDTGDTTKQIVCGAANVKDAEYVAVATIGTVLGDDFHIKPAELRGVKSEGMVCSSSELGLPSINEGIMILDESIGILKVGKELNQYPNIADTIIELELTANRGDCLSIHGVARDLSATLDKDIKKIELQGNESSKITIAKKYMLTNRASTPLDLHYKLLQNDNMADTLLIDLRLGFVRLESSDALSNMLQYSTHATGVILRAYDSEKLQEDGRATLTLKNRAENLVVIERNGLLLSTIGINQTEEMIPDSITKEILIEASYISPQYLIEGVASSDTKTDTLYYKTSRGSEPDLDFGIRYLELQCSTTGDTSFSDSSLTIRNEREERVIVVNFDELDNIIGQATSRSMVSGILLRLGFRIHRSKGAESFGVSVPPHRHDIDNIQDIAEEVLRIIGINNIEAKPLELTEKVRLSESAMLYKQKRDLRCRAVGRGFFEAVTYAFCDKAKLEKYGFDLVEESMALINPIAEEFDGMRSTLLINLLDAVKRNTSYGIKRIPLFEIGTVFDSKRDEYEKIAFVWSGNRDNDTVKNHGKSQLIDFPEFASKLSAIIGQFDLKECESENGLMHPYQSAQIIKNGEKIGFISKLHPSVAEAYGIPDTVIAEMDFDPLVSKHISARPISNYQGVYKDLSIVVDNELSFSEISNSIKQVKESILKRFYPVDVYRDTDLGKDKSVTIRFFIQSMDGTMSDAVIDELMQKILNTLEANYGASIR